MSSKALALAQRTVKYKPSPFQSLFFSILSFSLYNSMKLKSQLFNPTRAKIALKIRQNFAHFRKQIWYSCTPAPSLFHRTSVNILVHRHYYTYIHMYVYLCIYIFMYIMLCANQNWFGQNRFGQHFNSKWRWRPCPSIEAKLDTLGSTLS